MEGPEDAAMTGWSGVTAVPLTSVMASVTVTVPGRLPDDSGTGLWNQTALKRNPRLKLSSCVSLG